MGATLGMFEPGSILMFIGFAIAAYSVVGNDSIQTLGTFIASNKTVKWYYQWAFTSSILVAVIVYSYVAYGGDISFGRLEKIPFVETNWMHLAAPIALLFLTRFGIPVSTSLLVLSAFTSSVVFSSILTKSALGYGLAAIVAYVLWYSIYKWDNKHTPVAPEHERYWRVAQWLSTAFLWGTWLAHDVANIAVFLPRPMSLGMLLFVLAIFVAGMAYILFRRGGAIQHIVLEKTHTNYLRSATIIDLCYAFILLFFIELNNVPMSTTWVFLGLLSGRELAIASRTPDYHLKNVFPIVGKDILRLLFGLAVSVAIALFVQGINA